MEVRNCQALAFRLWLHGSVPERYGVPTELPGPFCRWVRVSSPFSYRFPMSCMNFGADLKSNDFGSLAVGCQDFVEKQLYSAMKEACGERGSRHLLPPMQQIETGSGYI